MAVLLRTELLESYSGFDEKNIRDDGAIRNLLRQVRGRNSICAFGMDTTDCIRAAGGSLQLVTASFTVSPI